MNRIFTNAIVRKPCPELVKGLTTAKLGKPDCFLALEQHSRYVDILKHFGLQVTVLESDSNYPDSTFIEDVALCTSKCAVITNPGAASRNGEKQGIRPIRSNFLIALKR